MSWGDFRDVTLKERINIGFNGVKESWSQALATFSPGKLIICGHPVMEDWEDSYMKILAAIACTVPDKVLEVGFGLGISASHVQQHQVREHSIIEANQSVYEQLLKFSQNAVGSVRPHLGFWEDVTPTLPDEYFDGILFDTYPLSDKEVHENHFSFFAEAFRLLKPGGRLTYYSDEPTELSRRHVAVLQQAGFNRDGIHWRVCPVTPPEDCQYWRASTIVAPIIEKI
ncbi:MAG: class I SAM-dependent methyltransferase [Patescibacteria group bacterium]